MGAAFRPGRTLPRRAAALLAAALLATPAPQALAGGVTVVRSSDLPVFERATEAFRRAYGAPTTEISLGALDAEGALGQIRAANPEIVVAIGLRAADLVRDRLPRTSLVYCMVPSPERHDLVGSRITGVSADIPPALELGLLREVAPDARRIGVLVGKDSDAWVHDAQAAAGKLHVELVVERIESIDRLGPGLRSLLGRCDALWMPADAEVATPEAFRFLLAEALRSRLPLFAFAPALVRAGALAAAAPDLEWVAGKLVEAVRRVQSGERAGDVPSTPVRRVKLVANLTTAQALGRQLPAAALSDAELVR